MSRKFLLFTALVFLSFSGQVLAEAPELALESDSQEVGIGEEFRVDLVVTADIDDPVYFMEATLEGEGNRLELLSLSIENSVMSLWKDIPKIGKKISFSGNMPRGYPLSGTGQESGIVYSITGRAGTAGQKIFTLSDINIQVGPKAENVISYTDKEFIITVLPIFEERLIDENGAVTSEDSEALPSSNPPETSSEKNTLKYLLIVIGIIGFFLIAISLKDGISKDRQVE